MLTEIDTDFDIDMLASKASWFEFSLHGIIF